MTKRGKQDVHKSENRFDSGSEYSEDFETDSEPDLPALSMLGTPERGTLSSPSSSLSSPEHPGTLVRNLETMLRQIQQVRRETRDAVERLAPHIPQLLTVMDGLEQEATQHCAAFQGIFNGALGQSLNILPGYIHHKPGGAAEPSFDVDVSTAGQMTNGSGAQEMIPAVDHGPHEVASTPNENFTSPWAPAQGSSVAMQDDAAVVLPPGILVGGVAEVKKETTRELCSHVLSICTLQEFSLDQYVNPYNYSIPAFTHEHHHCVVELPDSPVANLDDYLDKALAFIDRWAAGEPPPANASSPNKRHHILLHSLHGFSRTAAILCAWVQRRRRVRASLANILKGVRTIAPLAAPNFGFIAQLLKSEPIGQEPSIKVWEYAGLTRDEWVTELRCGQKLAGGYDPTSKAHGLKLNKRSARRILALGLRRRRSGLQTHSGVFTVDTVPCAGATMNFFSLVEVD